MDNDIKITFVDKKIYSTNDGYYRVDYMYRDKTGQYAGKLFFTDRSDAIKKIREFTKKCKF